MLPLPYNKASTMQPNRLLLSLLVPPVALVSAASTAKPATDDYIAQLIRQKLAADQIVKGGALAVDVKDGVVTLSGNLGEPKQKERAEKIARKVRGVWPS